MCVCTCLGVVAVLHDLGDVHVPDLDGPVLGQEAVGGLEVWYMNEWLGVWCGVCESVKKKKDTLRAGVLGGGVCEWGRGRKQLVGFRSVIGGCWCV